MTKKYFFFQSKHEFEKNEDDEMGRKRNRKKWWKNKKNQETGNRAVKVGFADRSYACGDDDYDFSTTKYTSPTSSNYYHNAYKKQDAVDPDRVISSDQGFLEIHHSDAWGTVLVPVDDPKAHKVTLDELNGIKLVNDFPKIPLKLWSRWVKLARYFCEKQTEIKGNNPTPEKPKLSKTWNAEIRSYDYYHHINGQKYKIEDPEKVLGPGCKYGGIDCEYTSSVESKSTYQTSYSDLEVSVLLCRKADDLRQWKILVPKQQVSHASVRAETKDTIDIETGEVYDVFPPLGWYHAGSSHSHNNFNPFYSSTDDESELTVPGLHIVLGNIRPEAKTHDSKASVVLRRLRKHVDIDDVVEKGLDEEANFHTKVLEYISTTFASSSTWSGSKAWAQKTEDDEFDRPTATTTTTPAIWTPGSGETCKSGDDRKPDDETPRSSVSAETLDDMAKEDWWARMCGFRDGIKDPARCPDEKKIPWDPRHDPDEHLYGWC